MENAVQRRSWWEGRMGLQSQAAAVETQRTDGLKIQPFPLPEGFSAPSCLLLRFPAPSSPNTAHSPVYHSSPFPPHPLDQITGPLIQLDQFSIMIGDHYWSGPVPKNLGRLIYLILTTSYRDFTFNISTS